jgi:hypothetical protein
MRKLLTRPQGDVANCDYWQVFHNIDYFMMTIRLLMKDYEHLAKCLVPIGEEQLGWTLEERIAHLKSRTRRFTAEEMKLKYN